VLAAGVSKVDARKLQYYARVNAAKSKGLDRKTQKKANKFTGALDTGLQRTLSASNSYVDTHSLQRRVFDACANGRRLLA
jgi:hypothetical protein